MTKPKCALISVSDKTDIVSFAKKLQSYDIRIISTGGTAKELQKAKIPVTEISALTDSPEMLDGRVKTLHPTIHAGILYDRENKKHKLQIDNMGICSIDIVVVNLYPFQDKVTPKMSMDEAIEYIDVGGVTLIRSAAKNHKHLAIVTDPKDYDLVIQKIDEQVNLEKDNSDFNFHLAKKAFAMTAGYDKAISSWFENQSSEGLASSTTDEFNLSVKQLTALKYGENPQQKAALYEDKNSKGIAQAKQLQGKDLGYNNYLDGDTSMGIVANINKPAIAIIKHATPCGVAIGDTALSAWKKALAADPVSAFGGVIACNHNIDVATAKEITKIFFEVLIAPTIDEDAIAILKEKPNARILLTNNNYVPSKQVIQAVSGGFLVQDSDKPTEDDTWQWVTEKIASQEEQKDLEFAWRVAKFARSNAIVAVSDLATIGIGAGRTNRLDAIKSALQKVETSSMQTIVLASDGFFPFADNVEAAAEKGVTAIIQPGGSKKDDEVIEAANRMNISMCFTGKRHFRH